MEQDKIVHPFTASVHSLPQMMSFPVGLLGDLLLTELAYSLLLVPQQQEQLYPLERLFGFKHPQTSEYVFASPKIGGKLTGWKKKFQAARMKAKLENFRFHEIRHTFATRIADAGVDILTLAELLGHGDIRITKRYAHGTEENKRQAVEKLVKSSNLT
jgi:integrase